MIKAHVVFFRRLMILGDAAIVWLSFAFAYFARGSLSALYPPGAYLKACFMVCLIWVSMLYAFGMYESFRMRGKREIYLIILKATAAGFFLFSGILYLFKMEYVSRSLSMLVFAITALLTILEKTLVMAFFRDIRRKGLNYRSLLIVGTGKRARHFIDLAVQHKEFGFKILGLIDDDAVKKGQELHGCKVLGTLEDMREIILANVVDEVIFIVPRSWLNKIEELMSFCESQGLPVHLAVDYFELKLSRARLGNLADIPLLTFETGPGKLEHLFLKRLFDICVSSALLLIASPLFLIIAVLIKMFSPGRAFFRQERCSLNGRRFTLYKFRTMSEDAESRLSEVLPLNEMSGPVFKISNDPRITGLGRFLRKFSLDELPQLYNVFKGDMSLIGPRPPLPSEVEKYDFWHRRRLSMRPGITCLWQVNGRSSIVDFDRWARLDLEYIDNWSLWLDLKIFFKTIPAVALGNGAR